MSKYVVINSTDHKGARCNVTIPNTYGNNDWVFTPYYPENTEVEGRATLNSLNPYHLYAGNKFGLVQMNTAELKEYEKEVIKTKKIFKKTKTYNVSALAENKAAEQDIDFLTALHKITWSLVFNKIAAFKLVVARWDQSKENLIRAFITHGTTCYIHIINVGKFTIEPVADISSHPVFQQLCYKVKNNKEYIQAQRDFYRHKDAVEKDIYFKTLIAMSELREAVKADKLDNYYDRYFYVWNRANKEVIYYNDYIDDIEQYQDFISEELPEIIDTIRTWSNAFDIVLPNTLIEFISEFDSYYIWNTQWKEQERAIVLEDSIKYFIQDVHMPIETKHKYAGNEKHYDLNLTFNDIDFKLFALKKQNYMRFQQLLDMGTIHNIYTQINWYLDNGAENWLSDKYIICQRPTCECPMSINSERCPHCDAPNPYYIGEEKTYSFEAYFGNSSEETRYNSNEEFNVNVQAKEISGYYYSTDTDCIIHVEQPEAEVYRAYAEAFVNEIVKLNQLLNTAKNYNLK